MSSLPEFSVFNHQEVIELSHDLVNRLQTSGQLAIPKALAVAKISESPLSQLEEVEVSIIDDETIAEVHLRFMDVPGATDVITFDHGEIHLSAETARSQSREFDNDFEQELMLYIVHGLLHLAGHEDSTEQGNATMDSLQQSILNEVWTTE